MEKLYRGLNHSFGWLFSLMVIIWPVALWVTFSMVPDPSKLAGALTVLAKFCALTGFAAYAWSLILGTRLRIMESAFGGLDKLYIAHRVIGGTSILLILMHPIFLSLRVWISSFGKVLTLWNPLTSFYLGMGILAFVIMMSAVVVTYWVKVKHQTFVKVHALLGWAIIPSMLHVFLAQGAMARNEPLRSYMLILALLAVLVFFYHTVFGKWLIKRYKYTVQKVVQLGDNITEVYLKPSLRPISYTPGQLAFVSIIDPAVDAEPHPFALTEHHHSRNTSIVVKNLGDWTSKMPELTVGSKVLLDGPHGQFSYLNTKNKKQIWVAGGIGITPFLAMARAFRKKMNYHIDMYYCTKTEAEAVFFRELHAIANKHKNFRLIGVVEANDGFLTADKIAELSGDLAQREVFICGPPIMMKTLQQQLLQKRVPADQIHFEDFSF